VAGSPVRFHSPKEIFGKLYRMHACMNAVKIAIM